MPLPEVVHIVIQNLIVDDGKFQVSTSSVVSKRSDTDTREEKIADFVKGNHGVASMVQIDNGMPRKITPTLADPVISDPQPHGRAGRDLRQPQIIAVLAIGIDGPASQIKEIIADHINIP